MIHSWKDDAAKYAVMFKGKEYVLYLRRDGSGVCLSEQEAWKTISRGALGKIPAILRALSKPEAYNRAAGIEEEFSFDIQLSPEVTQAIWRCWKIADLDNPQNRMPEIIEEQEQLIEWLDCALVPILEANLS